MSAESKLPAVLVIVEYGAKRTFVDCTRQAFQKCLVGRELRFPVTDAMRATIFGDPLIGTLKEVRITYFNTDTGKRSKLTIPSMSICDSDATLADELRIVSRLPDGVDAVLHASEDKVLPRYLASRVWFQSFKGTVEEKAARIHSFLTLAIDTRNLPFNDELPEQLMALRYIKDDARVLEIGANSGRNSLVISTLLADQTQQVSLECDAASARAVEENRNNNGYAFHIEPKALSARRLVQKDWDTKPIEAKEAVPAGWTEVPTLTYAALRSKYPIPFDTLVADCEGSLFYILQDTPEILDGIKTVIIENDFVDIEHKRFVDKVMIKKGLLRVYVEAGGWEPCVDFFYEVWQRHDKSPV